MKIKNIFATAATLTAFFTVLVVDNASCCETLPQRIYLSKPDETLTRLHANNSRYSIEINHNARTIQITGNLSDPVMKGVIDIYSRLILNPVLCPGNNFHVTVEPTNTFTINDTWSFPTDMESLTFRANYLGNIGAMRLAQGLPGFLNLESLDLSGNNIGDDSALLIAWRLPRSVRNLNLSHNRISPAEQQEIRNLIHQKAPNCVVAF